MTIENQILKWGIVHKVLWPLTGTKLHYIVIKQQQTNMAKIKHMICDSKFSITTFIGEQNSMRTELRNFLCTACMFPEKKLYF